MNWYGLGLNLNARDNASSSINSVNNSFNNLTSAVEQTTNATTSGVNQMNNTMQSLNNVMFAGMGMKQLGDTMTGFGTSMMKPLVDIGKQTISTGSQFEQWRMTLKALYKDADKAKAKLDWGMDLAVKTPFEMTDITQALIGFKAVGVEADAQFKNANGEMRSFLEYMGDLAALRPDVGLQGVMLGVRNLLGGDGGKSLRMRMDIDFSKIIGEKWGKDSATIMKQLVKASDKLANGLMGELEGTWSQMISNLKDQSTRFFLAIADNGAFDTAKATLKYISDAFSLNNISDEKLKNIGTNVAQALQMVWKPIDFIVKGITDIVSHLINLAEQHPMLLKIAVGFTTILAGIISISGVLIALGGTFMMAVAGVRLFFASLINLRGNLAFIGRAMLGVITKASKFALIGGVIFKAWKSDFGGVRTTLTNLMKDVQTAFSYSTDIANMSCADMMNALDNLQTNTFGGWLTYQLVKLKVLWMGLVDVWNDNTLSDENFRKLQELGLLPLIELFIECKERVQAFIKGVSEGFQEASTVVASVVGFIGRCLTDLINFFLPVDKQISQLSDAFKKSDLSVWTQFGRIVGFVGGLFITYKIASKIMKIGKSIAMIPIGLVKTLFGAFSSVGRAVVGGVRHVGTFARGVASLPTRGINAVRDGWDTVKLASMYAKDHLVNFKNGLMNFPTRAMGLVRSGWDKIKLSSMSASTKLSSFKRSLSNLPTRAISGARNAFSRLSGGIRGCISSVGRFGGSLKNLAIGGFTRLKGAITGGLSAIGRFSLGSALAGAKTLFMTGASKLATVAMAGLNLVLSANPIALVVIAIVGLVAGIIYLWNTSESFRTSVMEIISAIGGHLSWFWETILSPLLSFVGDIFMAGIIGAFENIKGIVTPIITAIGDVIGGFIDILDGLITFIAGVFTGNWEKCWEGLSKIFGGVFDGLVGIAKAPLNLIIGLVNGLIGGLNMFIDGANWIPGVNLGQIPKIPYLAKGGVVDKSTLAMIGEDGQEAVVPLQNNTEWTGKVALMLGNELNGLFKQSSTPTPDYPNPTEDTMGMISKLTSSFGSKLSDIANHFTITNEVSEPQEITMDISWVKILDTSLKDFSDSLTTLNLNKDAENKSTFIPFPKETNSKAVLFEEDLSKVANRLPIPNISVHSPQTMGEVTKKESLNTFNSSDLDKAMSSSSKFNKATTENISTVNNNRNSTSNSSSVDNSIIFNQGSIQINLASGDEHDADKLFKEFMKKLKKETELRKVLSYGR